MRPLPRSLRARLSLSIAAILVVAVGTTFLVIYRGTGSTLRAQVDTRLRTQAQAFAGKGLARASSPGELTTRARQYVRTQGFGPSARVLALTLGDGQVVTSEPELLGLRHESDRESARTQSVEDRQARRILSAPSGLDTVQLEDVGALRVITRPVLRRGKRVATVRVGEPLASVQRAQDGVIRAFALAGSLTLLAALVAGYLVAARTADPLRRMARTAAAIDAGDLSHRIGPGGPAEEVRMLSESFDGMLDRLDDAFARQREFVSDASHELRTPLTVIRGQLEVLARSPEVTVEDIRRVEGIVGSEVTRMQRLVDDLLLLARTQEGDPVRLAPVDVEAFLAEQVEAVGPTADRRFELGAVCAGTVDADADALARAVRNLTRNAVEHTAAGGCVRVSALARGDRVQIAVEDDGPGIPAGERARVFERFHRVRPTGSQGSGLGLAIARAIVDAHGGQIWAADADGQGARVAFELPRFSPG